MKTIKLHSRIDGVNGKRWNHMQERFAERAANPHVVFLFRCYSNPDLGFQFLGGHRDLVGGWCNDQRSGLTTNSFELSGSGSMRQMLEIDRERLARFDKPLCTISI